MEIPTIIHIPHELYIKERSLEVVIKALDNILGEKEYIPFSKHGVNDWDIVLPRFVGWRKYRKLKKDALKNLRRIKEWK